MLDKSCFQEKDNKRILFLSLCNMGGCQRVTVNYAKILSCRGYKCHFLFWVDSEDDENAVCELLPKEISYESLNCRLRELPTALYKFIRGKGGYDCVFSSWVTFNIALCITKSMPFNKIGTLILRDDNMPSRHGQIYKLAYRLVGNKANLLIAQTNEMQAEFEKVYHLHKNTITIPNPIDKELIKKSIDEGVRNGIKLAGNPVFIASGRINPQKDYLTMIRAFCQVKENLRQAKLYILGEEGLESDYGKKVKEEIKKIGLEEDVEFLGFQSNPFQYIAKSNVFVLSSVYEGLPNVLIEALYMGLPVAATMCIPYVKQKVEEGVTGFLSSPQNVEMLCQAMIKASKLPIREVGLDVNNSEEMLISTFEELLSK